MLAGVRSWSRAVGVAKRLGVRRRVLGHVVVRVGVREDVILAAAVDVERAALREGLDDVVRVGVCEFAHQYVRREHHLGRRDGPRGARRVLGGALNGN